MVGRNSLAIAEKNKHAEIVNRINRLKILLRRGGQEILNLMMYIRRHSKFRGTIKKLTKERELINS
jgi:hypothetical protein